MGKTVPLLFPLYREEKQEEKPSESLLIDPETVPETNKHKTEAG